MGLALTSESPTWNISGAFLILWLLGFLMSYVIGRLVYFSTLVTILTNHLDSSWLFTLRSGTSEVMSILEKISKENILSKFGYYFRKSFQSYSLVISLLMGLGISSVLFVLGLLYLGDIKIEILTSVIFISYF